MEVASLPIWEGEIPPSIKYATPTSPFTLRDLQDFVANPKSNVFAVNVGGSFPDCVRTKQIQHEAIAISRKKFRVGVGVARGQSRYAKDPKSSGRPQVVIYKRGAAVCER